jgi:MYXO-CTERM domain-containing protein
MSKLKHALTLLTVLFTLLVSSKAHATHFRYGNITYTIPDPASPTTVRFVVTTAWRSAFIGTTTLDFGDGFQNPDTAGVAFATGVDATGLQYTFQNYVVTHTYAVPGQYIASFFSCCRLSNLVNAHDDNFQVQARVDTTTGNTGNPISLIPAIIQLQVGGVRSHFIPAVDPDATAVTCRFGTSAESGITTTPPISSGTNKIPTLSVNASPPGCLLTWDLTGATAGQQYANNVVLETTNPNNNQKNTAVLDYIIEFVSSPIPTCAGTGTFTIPMGTQFTTNMIGTNTSGGPTLTLTSIYSTGVLTPVSGSTQASPFTSTLSWKPGQGEQGTSLATVIYTDQHNESGFCSLTLIVPSCPIFGTPCAAGIGACQKPGIMTCPLMGPPVCNAVPGAPSAETCDGIDNNCDGQVDEGNPGAGADCMSGLPGVCSPGLTTCAPGGVLQCVPDIAPGANAETCNGVDDDCDGTVDNGFNVGAICFNGVGGCKKSGTVSCDMMGGSSCDAVAGAPKPEVCNNVDDDCNGTVDDGFNVGGMCMGGTGACQAPGSFICNPQGMIVCDAMLGTPSPEICGNQTDEDCDGQLDNGCKDSDGDGVFDTVEAAIGSDPADADSDDDGVPDGDEVNGLEDTDGDGLVNILDPDSDNDGLYDGTEMGLDCNGPGTDKSKHHCIPDADPKTKTDPLKADTDSGGARDGSEDPNLNGKIDSGETDPNSLGDDGSVLDTDMDKVGDLLEAYLHSDPMDADTDDDGVPDGDEANPADDHDGDGLNSLLDVDSDDDALFDGTEIGNNCLNPATDQNKGHCRPDANHGVTRTCPLKKDTDGGGMSDGSEDYNLNGLVDPGEGDPNQPKDDSKIDDVDGDGLGDKLETKLGSGTHDADSDDDGLLDGDEPNPSDDHDHDGKLNVVDSDSDGDGLFDGTEAGKVCAHADTDLSKKQCLSDGDSGKTKTVVLNKDTDWGGALDGDEDFNHDGVKAMLERDPLDPTDDKNAPDCTSDKDCGGAESGKVCDAATLKCVNGCRGSGGNVCPLGQACSSTDATIGTCAGDHGTGGGGGGGSVSPGETGCACRVGGDPSSEAAAWLFAAALSVAGMRRRRSARAR